MRKHQGGLGHCAAQLLQRSRGPVQDPVVAAGVVAPNLLCVRENQQLFRVVGPVVVINRQRLGRFGRSEGRRRDQDGTRPRRRVIASDFLRLQGRIGRSLIDPAGRAEGFCLQIFGVKNLVEVPIQLLGSLQGADYGENQGGENNMAGAHSLQNSEHKATSF